LDLNRHFAPGSTSEAESLHELGVILRKRGDLEQAARFFCDAAATLDKQGTRLGGTSETVTRFRAHYYLYYHDCISTLVDTQRPQEAFAVFERSRARSLLNLLAERDLDFAADAPAELLRERALNAAEYDRTQAAVSELAPAKDGQRIDALLQKMRELNTQREEIAARIRKSSPRLAALQYPQPLDLQGARQALDPGTVLLAYSTGETESLVFVLQSGQDDPGFSVHRLAVGQEELRKRVNAFRSLIERRSETAAEAAADLYEILLGPANKAIVLSKRVLIVADGPLHMLPFAALRRDGRYLAEWKPSCTIASATLYAELRRRTSTRGQHAVQIALFGDPNSRGSGGTEEELKHAQRRGFQLNPLPASRDEVKKIADLYATGSRIVYLGAEATEEHAKALNTDIRYVHFATHGLLDEQFPLNSALVLSIPDAASGAQENGLLQAWEIFEQVRLNADLVTLSACETALGSELGGEGLIGLTRAFQYAGARTVLASLWSVEDSSTADFMQRFYRHLKGGESEDAALQAAQIEQLQGEQYRLPFYWAGFELAGSPIPER
jgi:CHAT domain-containing protein